MHEQEHKLQSLLTGQNFNTKGNLNELLETAKAIPMRTLKLPMALLSSLISKTM